MAILLGVCHSVLISGKLSEKNIISLNIPFEDIKSNLWQVSFNQFSYKCLEDNINVLCGISCNLVTDLAYNKQKQCIRTEPILLQLQVKGSLNEKNSIQYDKTWFYITDAQSTIQITFHILDNATISLAQQINCEIYATILLQRVK